MQTSDLNVNNTESDHANAIFRQFQDSIFSREHTYIKTLTKKILGLLQSLPKKAAIASFIWTTFRGHFRLGTNDITRNRSRVIFSRECVDIFRWWNRSQSWYVCFSAVNWYCFKFIWAHRSIFLIPSPQACHGRTVLQFPTNSYHLFTVELALKAVLALVSGVNGLCYANYPPLVDSRAAPSWWASIRAN